MSEAPRQLPAGTGAGYDPHGPRLWHVEAWRDGVQDNWSSIRASIEESRRRDERELNMRAEYVLADHDARARGLCCASHRDRDCCDPDDCGPCCVDCPTCPAQNRRAT